ncbi:hypothetical protein ACQY0O_000939 [Thecaphora frezii]
MDDVPAPSQSASAQQPAPSEQYLRSQTAPTLAYDRDAVYTQLQELTRDNQEFESGLGAILGPLATSGATQHQIDETKQRAKVFFFMSKTGIQVDNDDYLAWLSTQSTSATTAEQQPSNPTETPTVAAAAHDPYPASFDSIVELIATGQTDKIAGIRDIPLQINQQPPTKAAMSRPSKPWERGNQTFQESADTLQEPDLSAQQVSQ